MITPYFNDNDNFVLYNGDANTVYRAQNEVYNVG